MIDSVIWAQYINVKATQTAMSPQQYPPVFITAQCSILHRIIISHWALCQHSRALHRQPHCAFCPHFPYPCVVCMLVSCTDLLAPMPVSISSVCNAHCLPAPVCAPIACPVPSQCPVSLLWHMAGKVPREKKNANFLASTHYPLPKFLPQTRTNPVCKTIPGAP